MDRGAWWATVHRITQSDMTEQLPLSVYALYNYTILKIPERFTISFFLQTFSLSQKSNCYFTASVIND